MGFIRHKKKIIVGIEIILLVIFLIYLFFYVDWKSILYNLQSANKVLFLTAILFYFLKIVAESIRWKYVIRLFNTSVSTLKLVKAVTVAPFFSVITIIPKAEELFYFYFIKNEVKESTTALSIIITNRIIALSSLLILLPITLLYVYYHELSFALDAQKISRILFIGSVVLAGAGILLIILYKKQKVRTFLQKLSTLLKSTFYLLKKQPHLLINLYLITFTSHFLYALTVYYLCASLSIEVPVIALFLSIPIVYLFTSVMIGMKGIGIKEAIWAFIILFFSISETKAIALSSLHFILSLIFIFIGLLLYLTNKQRYGANA